MRSIWSRIGDRLFEGLLSRLLASGRITSLCGLSAVVENGEELAEWLGIDFLESTSEDRPVVLKLRDRIVQDIDKALKGELRACHDGGQFFVSNAISPLAKRFEQLLAPASPPGEP